MALNYGPDQLANQLVSSAFGESTAPELPGVINNWRNQIVQNSATINNAIQLLVKTIDTLDGAAPREALEDASTAADKVSHGGDIHLIRSTLADQAIVVTALHKEVVRLMEILGYE